MSTIGNKSHTIDLNIMKILLYTNKFKLNNKKNFFYKNSTINKCDMNKTDRYLMFNYKNIVQYYKITKI